MEPSPHDRIRTLETALYEAADLLTAAWERLAQLELERLQALDAADRFRRLARPPP